MALGRRITSAHFPYILVKITVGVNSYDVESLIDTGFDGQIILPPKIFINGQLPTKFVTCKLADNSIVEIPIHIGSIELGNRKFNDIAVLIMGDEPMVGREVLKHFKVTLDHGRKVIIEP